MLAKVRDLESVRKGKSHVVKVADREARQRFKSSSKGPVSIKVVGNKVVLPKAAAGERATVNKKTGEITLHRKGYGGKETQIVYAPRSFDELFHFERAALKSKRRYQYVLHLPGGATWRFTTVRELYDELGSSPKLAEARDTLAKYVTISSFDPDAETGETEE